MAKAYFYIKDSANKELQKIEVNITDFDTAPVGKQYNIELREVGLKVQYVGNYAKGSSLPLDPVVTPPVCPTGQHWDATLRQCVPDTTPTGLLYSSNIQGKWNNGGARFVTDREGNTGANGYGFTVNASGGGGFRIDGKGLGTIEPTGSGHRRIYPCVCNYNATIKGKFAFLTGKERNFSIKGRNRHQYRDMVDSNAPDSKCQGGLGIHFDIEGQTVGFQYEVVHGTNGGSVDKPLFNKLQVGKWYPFEYTYKDRSSTEIDIKVKLDYSDGKGLVTVLDHVTKPPSVFFNKADFDTWSQFWLRLNDEGKVNVRDVEVYAL